jgi:hypothetical protein
VTLLPRTFLAAGIALAVSGCGGQSQQSSDAAADTIDSLSSEELLATDESAPDDAQTLGATGAVDPEAAPVPPSMKSGSNRPGVQPPEPGRSKLIKADDS